MKPFKALLCVTVLAATAAAPFVRAEGTSVPAASATTAKENLTAEQKAGIDALVKEEHKAIKAVKEDPKLKDDQKAAKTKAIKKDYKEKIAAIKAGK
jgi:hypothetical protein